jgi:pimeloyl-ACP methyl ester carboxylesterase
MFDPVLPALTRQHQVIVPDLRGHGRSQHLPGPYTVPQLAADLVALLDTLALESVDVLGYSQGGAVAQQLAHDYPGRVRRLVLACTYFKILASARAA